MVSDIVDADIIFLFLQPHLHKYIIVIGWLCIF